MDPLTAVAWRAAHGDEEALGAFVRTTQGDVWRLCANLVDRGAADDLTQESYLRAVPALASFRGDSSARTWLLAIVRRVCMDELRRRARGRRLVDRVSALARPTVGADPAGALAVGALVAALDPDRRDAFVLTQVLGLSYAETAQVCGCELGTVRSRVARARADLVAALADGRAHGPAGAAEG